MATIDELTKKLIAFRKERDWEKFHSPKDLAISLSLEAAEVLEHFYPHTKLWLRNKAFTQLKNRLTERLK